MGNLFRSGLWILMLLGAVLLAGCEKTKLPSPFHASDISAMFTEANFHLTDHNGTQRSLADFRGKVVVVFFGYTHCPDVCPTTLVDLAQAMKLIGPDAGRVQVLFITVDPERDTQDRLAKYATAFDSSFLSLSGDEQAIAQAAKAFYVGYKKQATESGYNMDHTAGTFLVDPKGRVRLRAPHAQSAEWYADDIRLLLSGV